MSFNDVLTLSIYAIKPLISSIFVLLVATIVAFAVVLIKSRGMWFGKKNFGALSVFIELNSLLSIKFACAWLKCVLICFYLLSFTQLSSVHYLFLIVPSVIILLLNKSVIEFFAHFISIAIQLIGLFAANVLCSYILQFEMKLSYIFLYVLLALIFVLLSVYIFITEVDFISVRRSIKIELSRRETE